jgi:DNA-binding NtrC family response regulator
MSSAGLTTAEKNLKSAPSTTTVLLLDLEGGGRGSLFLNLGEETYQLTEAASADEALDTLTEGYVDVVLVLAGDDSASCLEVVKKIKCSAADPEVIVLASTCGERLTVEALRAGACDCLPATAPHELLILKLGQAADQRRIRRELVALRQDMAFSYGFDNLIGISKAMTELKEAARRIAMTGRPVLITGAPGTGKSLLAGIIHYNSPRRRQPLVTIDCGALEPASLEAELFSGGAAVTRSPHPTCLERAKGGSIFLDAVDRMPVSFQTRLLQLLEESRARQTGLPASENNTVRILAASDKEVSYLLAERKLSGEFYRRLNFAHLHLPPLAQRAEDIEILTAYFLRRAAEEFEKPQPAISREAVDKITTYHWPDNVRELQNTLRRAVAVACGDRLTRDDITFIPSTLSRAATDNVLVSGQGQQQNGLLHDSQRAVILKALTDNNWNFTQTARRLGIGRTTLWRKVKKYNLRPESTGQRQGSR